MDGWEHKMFLFRLRLFVGEPVRVCWTDVSRRRAHLERMMIPREAATATEAEAAKKATPSDESQRVYHRVIGFP